MKNAESTLKSNKLINRFAILGLAMTLAVGPANAQSGTPSSKVTAKTSSITLIPETTGTSDWQTVLANKIKTANNKDLFIGASLEVGLFTLTQAKSKNLQTDTSFSQADVEVRV